MNLLKLLGFRKDPPPKKQPNLRIYPYYDFEGKLGMTEAQFIAQFRGISDYSQTRTSVYDRNAQWEVPDEPETNFLMPNDMGIEWWMVADDD